MLASSACGSVQLRAAPVPPSGRSWKFTPPSRRRAGFDECHQSRRPKGRHGIRRPRGNRAKTRAAPPRKETMNMEDDYDEDHYHEEFFEDVEDGEIGYAWLLQARGIESAVRPLWCDLPRHAQSWLLRPLRRRHRGRFPGRLSRTSGGRSVPRFPTTPNPWRPRCTARNGRPFTMRSGTMPGCFGRVTAASRVSPAP